LRKIPQRASLLAGQTEITGHVVTQLRILGLDQHRLLQGVDQRKSVFPFLFFLLSHFLSLLFLQEKAWPGNHVLNRGVGRMQISRSEKDYDAFHRVVQQTRRADSHLCLRLDAEPLALHY
jgi:hypothetical protein